MANGDIDRGRPSASARPLRRQSSLLPPTALQKAGPMGMSCELEVSLFSSKGERDRIGRVRRIGLGTASTNGCGRDPMCQVAWWTCFPPPFVSATGSMSSAPWPPSSLQPAFPSSRRLRRPSRRRRRWCVTARRRCAGRRRRGPNEPNQPQDPTADGSDPRRHRRSLSSRSCSCPGQSGSPVERFARL